MPSVLTVALGAVTGILLLWVALVVVLWTHRPDQVRVRDALRLLPDLIRMFRGLATDREIPRRVRIVLWLLLGYLLLPVDLIPDFIPVLGLADDAIVVALTLRWVTRRAGSEALDRHWPGTVEGLTAVRALAGVPALDDR